MRWIPITFAVLSITLLSTACGGEKADSGAGTPFKSQARPPTGDPIHIKYAYGKGDGFRMSMKAVGAMEMDGESKPMNMTMAMTMQCTDVLDNGDRVLAVAIEGIEMNGEKPPGGGGADMRVSVTVGADGKMKELDLEGVDLMVAQTMKKALQGGGFATFLPFPPEGLRVGEAIDLAQVVPLETLMESLNTLSPGSSIKPEIHGEYVLVGTKVVDGVEAAEFTINMAMSMNGSMDRGEDSTTIDMQMTMTGVQYLALETGFPVGTATMKMDMSLVGGDESTGSDMDMKMNMRTTMTCERLK